MEGEKKPSSSSVVDELSSRKDAPGSADSFISSPSPGYFSSAFPPASTVMPKDPPQGDLFLTLNKQRTDGQNAAAEGKSQGSPSKRQTTQSKDGKPVDSSQQEESAYFGSSVHYGGRDFYVSSASNQSFGAPKSYKADEVDESGDTNIATRGEWWQGSLYY